MLDFLAALWDYAAEYFIALMGIAAFAAIVYYGDVKDKDCKRLRREQKKLLRAWGLK